MATWQAQITLVAADICRRHGTFLARASGDTGIV
jgi:hypothetical protein